MTVTKAMLKRKKPLSKEISFPDAEQQAALNQAEQKLSFERLSASDESGEALKAAEAALEAVKKDIRTKGVAFTLIAVGRTRIDELEIEHRATKEMQKEDEAKPEEQRRLVDYDNYWPALLAESVRDSNLTAAEWRKEVFDSPDWGDGELQRIRDTLRAINSASSVAELGN